MTPRQFLEQFTGPDPRFSPAPIWWWSGEKLEIGRMRWQMDQLRAMGIRNLVILNLAPSGVLFACDADDPPFLSEAWWEIFEQVCDHAREIGMFIWFYDQIGFSGANYQAEIVAAHPEFAADRLRRVEVEGTGSLRVECPGGATPLAAYVVQGESTRYLPIDGRAVAFDASLPARLNLVHTVRQGYDYYDRAACEKLLDTVHREFARRLPQHIGTTIVGSFQDELPDLPTWSSEFAATFEQSFGYCLEEVIHRLFEIGDADSRRTRLHYHQHRANLAEESLFKPFFRWHEEHGLQCGFDQQSPAREARVLGCVQKYADYIQTHRWYAIPGCDLHGNPKLHSSMAFMYDRPRVWMEGFHSTGWGGTIADTFDWLLPYLQGGSNFYNPHAVYYSTRMGWWEWAPPSTCWRQPYARHYRGFAEMIMRLTKLLSQGTLQATVGVLFPTATVQSAVGPQGHFPDAEFADKTLDRLIGSTRWHQAEQGVLDKAGVDFHLLDEATVQSGTLTPHAGNPLPTPSPGTPGEGRGGGLLCKGVTLNTLILPYVTILDDITLAQLRAFARAGGRVIAVGSPRIETPDGDTLDISTLPNATYVQRVEDARAALQDIPRNIRCPVPFMHRTLGDGLHLLFIPAVAGRATQVKWTDWFATLDSATADPKRYLASIELNLPPEAKTIWRFDPVDASVKALSAGDSKLSLDFRGAPFALLIWSDTEKEEAHAESRSSEILLNLSNDWSCEYVPTLPEKYPDIFDPRRADQRLPHTAELLWTHDGSPQLVRAGFGVHGLIDSEKPLVYSPQFGIAQDRMHWYTLGPKGHVPETFIDAGELKEGQTVTIRSGVISEDDRDAVLAVGANARKSAHFNAKLRDESDAHLWMTPVRLKRGQNELELQLTTQRDGRVRAFWCLLAPFPEEQFRRPERMIPPDVPIAGSRLVYRGTFSSSQRIVGGRVQVSVSAVASIYLDGQLLGRQGGFDPYHLHMRAQAYDLPPLAAGTHEIRIELLEPGKGAPLVVDLLAVDTGGQPVKFMSDESWSVGRDGGANQPVRLYSTQENDGAAWHLYRRPHPLPGAAWCEGEQPPVVLDLPVLPSVVAPVDQTFEWTIPPGAIEMQIRFERDVEATLRIDGVANAIAVDGTVSLGSIAHGARKAVLSVRSRHLGGGVFTAPITYRFGEGVLRTGSWLAQGLRSYSGAIRTRQRFMLSNLQSQIANRKSQIPKPPPFTSPGVPGEWEEGSITLDLGHVRGTVEAHLNGQPLGARFLPPYRFDLTSHLRAGENELELLVTNTLANFLSTWSPTRGWSPDQFECGVFGPVVVREVKKSFSGC